jgi:hypothetical protein
MSFKQRVRYFEKQILRPFLSRFKSRSGKAQYSRSHDMRLEALEARINELEQLIQEDLGLRLAKLDAALPSQTSGSKEP